VTVGFAERALLLAIVAVLAVAVALYPQRPKHKPAPKLPVGAGPWHDALAGANGGARPGKRSACGQVVQPGELGVAYAGLPCGAKIFVAYRKVVVLTAVVDQGPYVPGRAFDFTPALAKKVGLQGVQHVRWRFARKG
jgi:rare lipoprotein A (peptidoglycan hydrolase)